MKLAIFLSTIVHYNGKTYSTSASIVNMLKHFSGFFRSVLISPVVWGEEQQYEIEVEKLPVIPFPGWKNTKDRYLKSFFVLPRNLNKLLRMHRQEWDAIWIIDPDPVTQIAFVLSKFHKIPVVLYLRGNDIAEVISRHPHGIKRFLAKIWALWLEMSIPFMLDHSIGVVTGNALYRKYSHSKRQIIKYYASSITRDDLAKGFQRKTAQNLHLLMVGNLKNYKCIDAAIRSLHNIVKKGHGVYLDVVGEGPELPGLQKLTQELQLEDRVFFAGFVPSGEQLASYYSKADILLIPSTTEGTPKVVPEAFSYGLPIIASTVGGLPDMIQENYNGLFIRPGNSSDLTNAVLKILKNPGLLQKLSMGALETAPGYTIEHQLATLAGILKTSS